MRRLILLAACLGALAIAAPAAAQEPVSVAELLPNPDAFDGRTIALTGELIGDYGARPDGSVWAQLNDDSYAANPLLDGGALTGSNIGVGIRADATLFRGLDPPGRYKVRGPLVRAVGIWRHHDEGRSGESYLDVVSLEVVEPGRSLREEASTGIVVLGGILVTAAALLAAAGRRARRAA